MSRFSRFLRFAPDPTAVARQPRVRGREAASDALEPTVDERTAEMAKMLIDSPAFETVFDRLRAQRLLEITQSDPSPMAQHVREDAYRGVKALDVIMQDLTAMADELKLHANKRERNSAGN